MHTPAWRNPVRMTSHKPHSCVSLTVH